MTTFQKKELWKWNHCRAQLQNICLTIQGLFSFTISIVIHVQSHLKVTSSSYYFSWSFKLMMILCFVSAGKWSTKNPRNGRSAWVRSDQWSDKNPSTDSPSGLHSALEPDSFARLAVGEWGEYGLISCQSFCLITLCIIPHYHCSIQFHCRRLHNHNEIVFKFIVNEWCLGCK